MGTSKSAARRLILRSMVLGGSATAATKLLPDHWSKPMVDSVIAPAHAQMSTGMGDDGSTGMPTGIFQTDTRLLGASSHSPLDQTQALAKNASVLDYFIKPANAVVAMEEGDACDNVSPIVNLTFNVPENPGVVDICFDGIDLVSTVDGTSINDFGFKSTNFTNVTISETEITGDVDRQVGEKLTCMQSFSAPLVDGVFSCDGELEKL